MNTFRKLFIFLILPLSILLMSACNSGPEATKTWQPESEGILSASVSNTGKYALIGNASGKANLWELKKKHSLQHSWQHQSGDKGGIIDVDLSNDDKFAITAEKDSLAWWDVKSGEILGFWRIKNIKSIAISKDGQSAILGLRDHAQYLSLKRSKPIFNLAHPDFVKTVALSDDGRFAITGADNAEARLWSLKNGELLQTWKYKSKLFTVALSPDGNFAMTNAVLEETRIWKTKTGKLLHKLPPKRITISSVDFSSTNKKLITGQVNRRMDMWSLKTGERLNHWLPNKNSGWRPSAANIIALKFISSDEKILSITSNGIIQSWKSK